MPGKYKKEHGTTKLGDWLRKIGKSSLLKTAISVAGTATGVPFLNTVNNLIQTDNEITADQKKEAAKLYELDLQADVEEQKQITERWMSDNMADSWLSKNVRPIVLLWAWFVVTVIMFSKLFGADNLPSDYINLMSNSFWTINGAYFGGRFANKAITKWKKNNN